MNNQLGRFYLKNLNKDFFEPKDTLDGKIYDYIITQLHFDETGIFQKATASTPVDSVRSKTLNLVSANLPKMNMPVNQDGKPVATSFDAALRYELMYSGKDLINVFYRPMREPESKADVETLDIGIIEDIPVYPGCKGTNPELKACMSYTISNFISSRLNKKLLKSEIKEIVKISSEFTINTKGKITNIKAYSDHEDLNDEIMRILKLLPKFEPGRQKGKPVNVTYGLLFVMQLSP
ncbi:MAG: energy transducer TonB [Nonlabens sp.]